MIKYNKIEFNFKKYKAGSAREDQMFVMITTLNNCLSSAQTKYINTAYEVCFTGYVK